MQEVKVRNPRFNQRDDLFIMVEKAKGTPSKEITDKLNSKYNINRKTQSVDSRYWNLRKKGTTVSVLKEQVAKIPDADFTPFEEKQEESTELMSLSNYKNEKSALKHELRKVIVNQILKLDNGKILSLPADNFIFENLLQKKALKKNKSFSFLCVERDTKVYENGLKLALENGITYINKDLSKVLDVVENSKFSAMWLDFCSPFCNDVKENLNLISSKSLLKEEGLLAITLLNGRETEDLAELKSYLSTKETPTNSNARQVGFPRYVRSLFGKHLSLVSVYKYQDKEINTLSSPMLLYIFKLSNKNVKETKRLIEIKYSSLIEH